MSRTKKVRSNAEFSEPTQKNNPETAHFTTKTGIRKAVKIIPRNVHQEEYLEYLLNPEKKIIIASGRAGTGKTTIGLLAAIQALSQKQISRIILCRPSVTIDMEDHGFLPGTLEDKMEPHLIPLFDIINEYYSQKEINFMLENKILDVTPIAYARGRNFKNCYILVDESQGCSINQLKSLMTRLCDGAKLILTGDNTQTDKKLGENGLFEFCKLLERYGESKYIAVVDFTHAAIERDPVVEEVLKIFGDEK